MIRELGIANLGVIEHTRLPFGPGLTVLTGETGAGKTLITTALGQLLGAKPDATLVRHGEAEAVIECALTVPSVVQPQLDELGAVIDDDELLVTRTIGTTTRSRAVVGSRAVAAATLAEIVGSAVTLHGQHGQTRLTRSAEQRNLLDSAAGAQELLAAQRDAWQAVRSARQALADAMSAQSTATAQLERLRQLVADVESVLPQRNEDAEIAERIDVLARLDEVQQVCRRAHAALVGDGESDGTDALQLIAQVRRQLEHTTAPGPFRDWAARAVEIGELVTALAHDIDHFAVGLDADPATLDVLQQRKAAIGALLRRWNTGLDALVDEYEDAQRQLAFAADPAAQLAALQARVEQAEAAQETTCAALHTARADAATTLATAVEAELHDLGLAHATFRIDVTRSGEPTQYGDDVVEFQFSANPGLPVQPLASVGSGGELSRVMLALEVAAADERQRTFVFDEVDAGVGGKAALEVGKRLAALARTQQVIVVTHLPQVAAFADHHIVVEKQVDGDRTRTNTRVLEPGERAAEVARMLSGVDASTSAVAHADELLEMAAGIRRVGG